MNCTDWEERLALYAGGDLPAAKAVEVERHLAECAGCQLFASGLREGLELLQGAHEEVPAPAHFAAVRARVLAQLERERRPFWRRAWVYGLVAAAAAIWMAVAVRPSRWVVPPPPVVAVVNGPNPLKAGPQAESPMPLTSAVGRTPWSAADALAGLPRIASDLDSVGESGTRASRADQGVRPTINAESQRKWHWAESLPHKTALPRQRKPRARVVPGEALLVRMVTDNPDVVIYWISETRGEY